MKPTEATASESALLTMARECRSFYMRSGIPLGTAQGNAHLTEDTEVRKKKVSHKSFEIAKAHK